VACRKRGRDYQTRTETLVWMVAVAIDLSDMRTMVNLNRRSTFKSANRPPKNWLVLTAKICAQADYSLTPSTSHIARDMLARTSICDDTFNSSDVAYFNNSAKAIVNSQCKIQTKWATNLVCSNKFTGSMWTLLRFPNRKAWCNEQCVCTGYQYNFNKHFLFQHIRWGKFA
jgi:hypothetical protein